MKQSNLKLPPNASLREIQQYIKDMELERDFTQTTVVQNCLMMVEEVGELAKVLRKHHAGLRIDQDKKYDLDAAGEVTDILIYLIAIANRLDLDMEQAFRDKEEKNKQRTWS